MFRQLKIWWLTQIYPPEYRLQALRGLLQLLKHTRAQDYALRHLCQSSVSVHFPSLELYTEKLQLLNQQLAHQHPLELYWLQLPLNEVKLDQFLTTKQHTYIAVAALILPFTEAVEQYLHHGLQIQRSPEGFPPHYQRVLEGLTRHLYVLTVDLLRYPTKNES